MNNDLRSRIVYDPQELFPIPETDDLISLLEAGAHIYVLDFGLRDLADFS